MQPSAEVVFFRSPVELREWLAQHHQDAEELWVGFYKKGSGIPSTTWPEALDEALCYGWIDGIRRGIDKTSYTIRFTPRRPGSIWSVVNVKRALELIALDRMQPAGRKAFEDRNLEKSGFYGYERERLYLDNAYEEKLRSNANAWVFFQSRSPSYQRYALAWVMRARKEETRLSRLAALIEHSENGRIIPILTRSRKNEQQG